MSGNIKSFYEFEDFRLDMENPSLWRAGELVQIFPKSLEVLILLVRKKGEIVSREELLEKVWQNTFVEEANITYTISQLRKTLGRKNLIQTIPKHGYRFTAEIREVNETGNPAALVEPVPANPPGKAQIRWHFIAIVLLGVFFLTSFVAWWNVTDRKEFSNISNSNRNVRSIAVLPLKPLNDDEKSKALSLGLTDLLISRLGSLNRFAVRPLSSVNDFSENGQDPLKFGEELKVDVVLEGTLQTVEDRLRVNLRLWDIGRGIQIWQESFDTTDADFFDLQDTISANVTRSLITNLLEKDRELLVRRDTDNREAFQAYWRGRIFKDKRDFEKAIPEFEKAIELDPQYAHAYAGLSDVYSMKASLSDGADLQLYRKAEELGRQALQIEPQLSEGYLSLARVKYLAEWDWDGAIELIKRGIELDPNNMDAHLLNAYLLANLGRHDESFAELEKAKEIDPRSPYASTRYYSVLEKLGKYDEALKIAETLREMDGKDQFARRALGSIFLLKGEYAKVIELGKEAFSDLSEANYPWASMLATAFYKNGDASRSAEMIARLEQLSEKDSKALYFLAMAYSELGRTDDGMAVLQKCLKFREERLHSIKNEPRFAKLENDIRFRELLQRMNLKN